MNKIKQVLKEQGRMQSYLADKLDKSANTISLWCRNVVQPSIWDLYKVADLLDCEIDELLVKKDDLKKEDK